MKIKIKKSLLKQRIGDIIMGRGFKQQQSPVLEQQSQDLVLDGQRRQSLNYHIQQMNIQIGRMQNTGKDYTGQIEWQIKKIKQLFNTEQI